MLCLCCCMQGLSSCSEQRLLVAPGYVESSRTRDWTRVPCIGRQILYHWATREALRHILDSSFHSSFPHVYLVRKARIKRPGSWESSAIVLAVPSKALGPLASTSTFLGLFPPLKNALLLDCSPPSSSVLRISEARILEGVPFPSLQDSVLKIFSPGLWFWWRKGNPFQGMRVVLVWHLEKNCLRRGVLPKQETLLGRVAGAEGRRLRETERTALPHDSQSQVLWSLG